MLPSDTQIKMLHQKYAKTEADFELIYTHCQVVDEVAKQLLEAKPELAVNHELIHVGCMLHDIGVYAVRENGTFVQGIKHGTIGEQILKDEGYPEIIYRFASHHTGVGLTKQDIVSQDLPIPIGDYLAETNEERMVMYADKFHTKSDPPTFYTFEGYRTFVQQFGNDKALLFDELAELFGKPNLDILSKKFGHLIQDTGV